MTSRGQSSKKLSKKSCFLTIFPTTPLISIVFLSFLYHSNRRHFKCKGFYKEKQPFFQLLSVFDFSPRRHSNLTSKCRWGACQITGFSQWKMRKGQKSPVKTLFFFKSTWLNFKKVRKNQRLFITNFRSGMQWKIGVFRRLTAQWRIVLTKHFWASF